MVFPPFLPLGTTHTGLKSSCPPSPHSESCVFRRRRDGGGGEGGFEGLSSSLSFSPSEPACAALCSLPPSPCSTLFSFLPLLQLAPNENGKREEKRAKRTEVPLRRCFPPPPPLNAHYVTSPLFFPRYTCLSLLLFDYGHWPIPRVCGRKSAQCCISCPTTMPQEKTCSFFHLHDPSFVKGIAFLSLFSPSSFSHTYTSPLSAQPARGETDRPPPFLAVVRPPTVCPSAITFLMPPFSLLPFQNPRSLKEEDLWRKT